MALPPASSFEALLEHIWQPRFLSSNANRLMYQTQACSASGPYAACFTSAGTTGASSPWRWTPVMPLGFTAGKAISASPALLPDGSVVFAAEDGYVPSSE